MKCGKPAARFETKLVCVEEETRKHIYKCHMHDACSEGGLQFASSYSEENGEDIQEISMCNMSLLIVEKIMQNKIFEKIQNLQPYE